VTDAKRNPVRGLTQADFGIFEDGKLPPISNFLAIDATTGPESVVQLSKASRIRDLATTNLYLPATGTPKGPSFSVQVGEGKRDGSSVILPVEVRFDARDLMFVPGAEGKSRGSFTLFVTSGRELGDAAEVSQPAYEFEIPTPPESDTPANVLYTFGVRVRPDTRRLSIALSDDATGELAARVVPIDPSR